jgi:biotin carboxylase
MSAAPLAVAFDKGAATPGEAGVGASKLGPMVTVLGTSDYARSVAPVLRHFGSVISVADGLPEVAKQLADAGVRGIVTFSESMLAATTELAQAMGLPAHERETLRLLTDKFAQRQRLYEAGISPVRCRLVRKPADFSRAIAYTGLPAVLKPVCGEGSRDTYRIDDVATGRELAGQLLGQAHPGSAGRATFVIEEFLEGRPREPFGDYVSVECASAAGNVTPIAVTGKLPLLPPFREAGQFWPACLPSAQEQEAAALAVAAVRALGVTIGLTHTEVKLTPAGPRVIEVNGRLGGHLPELATRAADLDLIEIACRIAAGEDIPVSLPVLDRVYFQYWSPAPCVTCRLRHVYGHDEVRSLPGIAAVRPLLRPGGELAGSVGSTHLELICGEAPDHDSMLAMIDRSIELIRYVFDVQGDAVELSAAELRS